MCIPIYPPPIYLDTPFVRFLENFLPIPPPTIKTSVHLALKSIDKQTRMYIQNDRNSKFLTNFPLMNHIVPAKNYNLPLINLKRTNEWYCVDLWSDLTQQISKVNIYLHWKTAEKKYITSLFIAIGRRRMYVIFKIAFKKFIFEFRTLLNFL